MIEPKTGGCQCGHIRYEVIGAPLGLSVCHCRDCQRQSGSAFGMSLAISPESFHLGSGTLKSFEVVCESGRIKECSFCPECGTRIHHRTESGISLKAGTLDDASSLQPEAHYWTLRKQPWVEIPNDAPQFPDDG